MAIPILHLHPPRIKQGSYLFIDLGPEDMIRGIEVAVQIPQKEVLGDPCVHHFHISLNHTSPCITAPFILGFGSRMNKISCSHRVDKKFRPARVLSYDEE